MSVASSITGSISCTPATALINQQVMCSLTLTSTSSSTSTLSSVVPNSLFTGASEPMPSAANLGVVDLGPGSVMTIAPSGTVVLPFSMVFFAPSTGPLGAGFGTYTIGATVGFSDGSYLAPSTTTVFVNPIALPAAQQ